MLDTLTVHRVNELLLGFAAGTRRLESTIIGATNNIEKETLSLDTDWHVFLD
jgi:hypothetical protein